MSATIVAIELLGDRIDVAAVRAGRRRDARRLSVRLPPDGREWARTVREQVRELRGAVESMGVAGLPAAVLYRSPTQSVDLKSLELRSRSEARSAAVLSCVESLPYSLDAAVSRSVAVGRDRAGPAPRRHVVVALDRRESAGAIADLVQQAGLRLVSATPLDAAILAAAVSRALRHAGPDQGWLHVGENSSFFLLGGLGSLRFARYLAIGFRTLVQSLTRPIRMPGGEPFQLDDGTARRILFTHGLPHDDRVVHEKPTLTRRHIMPLVQPVLQRYVVELKQSLRFGLPGGDARSSIGITVTGPGSAIAGLAGLIGRELRLEAAADGRHAGFDPGAPAGPGSELMESLRRRRLLGSLDLQPADVVLRHEVVRVRRLLWAGAGIALLAMAADVARIESRLREAERAAAAHRVMSARVEALQATRQRIVVAAGAVEELERSVERELGARADLPAVMAEFSRITPPSIRLTSMRFVREHEALVGRAGGLAAPVAARKGHTELEPFVEALKGSPLLENVILRSVEVREAESQPGQRFEVEFALVDVGGAVAAAPAGRGAG